VAGPWRTRFDGRLTHQGAAPDDVIAAAWTALEGSDVFVGEADKLPAGHRLPAKYLFQRESLEVQLGHDDFDTLHAILDDVPRDTLRRLRPWAAFMLLGAKAYPFPSPNAGAAMLERARERKMKTEFSTLADQRRYFTSIDNPKP
jgi:hypothetical protein